jgi:HCOMODA/2-hydroxy-3-carboxy-muconic semialdehyde decarboxylase
VGGSETAGTPTTEARKARARAWFEDLRDRFGDTGMLVNDLAKGGALAETLGDAPAVLIRGHGVAVVGPGLPSSVGRSIYLEQNARVEAQAMALGGTVTYLSPGEAAAVLAAGENLGYERPWEMWKRRALGR